MISILTGRQSSDFFHGCASVIAPARLTVVTTELHCFHTGAFTVVTTALHSCHNCTSQLSRLHLTVVTLHFHCCHGCTFTVVTTALHCFHTGASQLSHLHFTVVTTALHCFHTGASQLSHLHFTVVTSALHCFHTGASQLSHLHFTVVTPALSQLSRRHFHSCHTGTFTVVIQALSQLSQLNFTVFTHALHSCHTCTFTVVTTAVSEISEDSCDRPIEKKHGRAGQITAKEQKNRNPLHSGNCVKKDKHRPQMPEHLRNCFRMRRFCFQEFSGRFRDKRNILFFSSGSVGFQIRPAAAVISGLVSAV